MNLNKFLSVFVSFIAILTFTSCEKSVPISSSVVPGLDDLNNNTIDTFSVFTKNVWSDTVSTSHKKYLLLGSMQDASFGTTYADILMQPDLSTNNLSFPGDVITLDSIVLSLDYAGYYGDTSVPQTFTVHELIDPFTRDSIYNNFSVLNYNPVSIGTLSNFVFQPTDSVVVGDDTTVAQVRIRLDQSWAQGFFSQSGSPNFVNASAFHDYFKGFYIKSESSQPGRAMCSFSRDGAYTRLNVYYHSDEEDSLSYAFNFNITNGVVNNKYTHDYNGILNTTMLTDPCQNPSAVDAMCYLQSMQGTSMRVSFPYLTDLSDLVVNKAVLQVFAKVDNSNADSIYTIPSSLALDVIDTTDNCALTYTANSLLLEKTEGGVEYYVYTFDVGDEVQTIIKSHDKYSFVISTYSQSTTVFSTYNAYNVNPHRIILYGTESDPIFKPRLFVTYTRIQ